MTEGWRPISFASRFLIAAEKKYSSSELEMLAVVRGAKYFRNYILGRSFTVITDHKALISLLNGNKKKNKTLFSRLTRWLDRLIPFDFVIEDKPGAKIGLADYLSRHPSEPPKPISQYDNLLKLRMSRWTRGNYTLVSYSQNFLLGSVKLETTRFKQNFSKILYQCSRRDG